VVRDVFAVAGTTRANNNSCLRSLLVLPWSVAGVIAA
jgi:hypothetical protein